MFTSMPSFRSVLYYFLIVLTVVACLYGVHLLWERYKPARFDELGMVQGAVELGENEVRDRPILMSFPQRNFSVPLVPGEIIDDTWSTSDEAATYITLNEGMIVYGHNFPRILGSLHQVKVGDSVKITDETGEKIQYLVTTIKQVYPEYTDSIVPTDEEPLVIYTCVGFLDTKRLVVRARLAVN